MKHQTPSLKRRLDKLDGVPRPSKKRKRSYTVNPEYTSTEHSERGQKRKVSPIDQQPHTKRACQSLSGHIFKRNNRGSTIGLGTDFNDRENTAVDAQATQPQQLTPEALQKAQGQYQRKFVHSKGSEWSYIMTYKNGARSISSHSETKRKGSASLLSSKSTKSITAYDTGFDDILEARHVVEAEDEEPKNWSALHSLLGRERASVPPEDHEIKGIREAVRRSSNENSVSHSVFPRIFPVRKVDTCKTLKEHWNRQWIHWTPHYANHDPKVVPPQPDYAIGYHTKLFPGGAVQKLQGLASPSKNKLAFPIFFAELKGASGTMNVAKLQNMHNGASAVYNLLRLHLAIGQGDDYYDQAWVLSLDTNGEVWRLRCHWVSREDYTYDTYYSKVLRCWAVEDPRDVVIVEARASMRNVVDWMREVMFKVLHTAMDTYERTVTTGASDPKSCLSSFKSQSQDPSTYSTSDYSSVDETQFTVFGTQLNYDSNSQKSEILKTCSESVLESIELASIHTSTTTQESSLSAHIQENIQEKNNTSKEEVKS